MRAKRPRAGRKRERRARGRPCSVSASDASASSARSASTARIAGWSISSAPNALRWRQWSSACAAAMRMPADEPIMQSKRVAATISRIVATPRPSGPTRQASARAIGFARGVGDVAHLALEADDQDRVLGFRPAASAARESRSGRRRLGQRQEGVADRAETKTCGRRVRRPRPLRRGRAEWRGSCWRARPSRPVSRSSPCRSSAPACWRRGCCADVDAGVDLRQPMFSPASGSLARLGVAAKVMVIGQPWPASICACM